MALTAKPDQPQAPYTLKQYRRFCQLIIDRDGSVLFCFLKLIDDLDIEAALWGTIQSDVDEYGNDARNKTYKHHLITQWYQLGFVETDKVIAYINSQVGFYQPLCDEAWQELSECEQSYVKKHLIPEALMALEIK